MKICGIKKFDSIYEEHYEKVFVAALGYMRDRYLAEEIFQETFLELYMRIDTVHSETAENWLLTVVKHKSINMLKYVATRQEQIGYFETDPDEIPSDSYGNIQRIEEQRDCNNLSRKIFDELYQENVTWYKAIVRVYCFGRSQREVAGEMGMNMGRFPSMLFRARGWIKRRYGKQYSELLDLDK